MPKIRLMLAALCLALPALAETPTPGGTLTVQLNKLEPSGDSCRAYFLFRNETGATFQAFQMSLALFDKKGVIDRLLAIDAAPLPVARTTLKLFDIEGLACDQIDQVLLHDIPACTPQNGEAMDCFPLIKLQSLAAAALVE